MRDDGLRFKCTRDTFPVGSFVTVHSESFLTGNVAARIADDLGTLPASYSEARRLCEIKPAFALSSGRSIDKCELNAPVEGSALWCSIVGERLTAAIAHVFQTFRRHAARLEVFDHGLRSPI